MVEVADIEEDSCMEARCCASAAVGWIDSSDLLGMGCFFGDFFSGFVATAVIFRAFFFFFFDSL